MIKPNYNRTRHACYYAYLALTSIFALPPLLYESFHRMYGISYTLLGSLALLNFVTQLSVDFIFSLFSKHFNIKLTLRTMPLLTSAGLLLYTLIPMLLPQYAYWGMALGTVVFSISAGLSEVLLSPTVAALPSDNPERDMSILHSLFAYGVLMVVTVSSVYLHIFGGENWMYLALFWAVLPLGTSVLFFIAPIPELNMDQQAKEKSPGGRNWKFALLFACIFFGSAAENTMSNWGSSFLESALSLPKFLGDIGGMAMFAVLLGIGRTVYAKYGKNIHKVLLFGMIGATVCYLAAATVTQPLVALFACAFTGICTSMLWPGALIYMEETVPNPGVAAYALMAAGGDLGAAVAPQLLGVVIDGVSNSSWAPQFATKLSLTTEQLGMKTGMLLAAVFPVLGIITLCICKKKLAVQSLPGASFHL